MPRPATSPPGRVTRPLLNYHFRVEADLRCPGAAPRQVFAIGLNYRNHAAESGMPIPAVPATFTRFPASLGGPFDDVEGVGQQVDWEVEPVAVIGTRADRSPRPTGGPMSPGSPPDHLIT